LRQAVFVCWLVRSLKILLGQKISKTVGDKDSVPMDHQKEMARGESNGHVIGDVT